jgi:HEAT repeat protein
VDIENWGVVMLDGDEIPNRIHGALERQRLQVSGEEPGRNEDLEFLIETPTRAVFESAEALCHSSVPNERLLGVRIIGELGRPSMPFSESSSALLVDMVQIETDDKLLSWEISALGNQGRARALNTLIAFVGHSDSEVRYALAGAISRSATESGLDVESSLALEELARDPDTEVRFSAIFELANWYSEGHDEAGIVSILARARSDRDSRIRKIVTEFGRS